MALADKPRRGDQPPGSCDACGKAEYLCPTCPRRPQGYKFNHGWEVAFANDRENAQAQMRNAKAARALAVCPPAHPAFPTLEREYIAAGEAILDLWERRRAARKAAA